MMAAAADAFTDAAAAPVVRGWLHRPAEGAAPAVVGGLVLAHGAGSNAAAPLLVSVAEAFARAGWLVLRLDLPFRQERPSGPPRAGDAVRDRAGLARAARIVGAMAGGGPPVLGGHSYGGRQCSMLAAEHPEVARALLLLSYPLHPPRQAGQLRTAHFAAWRTPALFVHGTRDPFGSLEEMRQALERIPARVRLVAVEGAGHDLAAAAAADVGSLALAGLAELLLLT